MQDNFVIDVRHLSKSFAGKLAVNNIALQIKKGEIFGFLGPNGSGKTTTIRMLCGLLTPDSAQGTCLGYDILTQSKEIKPYVGYMPQRFSLYDDLSVTENLELMARLYQVKNPKVIIEQAIVDLGLVDRRAQLAQTLSGGWKQRLALTAALLHNPPLLLLDEPTAGVDPKARRDFWNKVHNLAVQGITILVSTHYMDEALRCTRLAYMSFGNILAMGTAHEIIQQSQLVTWEVSGSNIHQRVEEWRDQAGMEQIVAFGSVLHVSGKNRDLLAETIKKLQRPQEQWREITPSLEDAFISMVDEKRTQ